MCQFSALFFAETDTSHPPYKNLTTIFFLQFIAGSNPVYKAMISTSCIKSKTTFWTVSGHHWSVWPIFVLAGLLKWSSEMTIISRLYWSPTKPKTNKMHLGWNLPKFNFRQEYFNSNLQTLQFQNTTFLSILHKYNFMQKWSWFSSFCICDLPTF